MPSVVQTRVDALGEVLRRSVVVNDPQVRLLYASRHYGDEDPVRIRAALHRDAGGDAIAHLLAQGVHQGSRAGRIPANDELGMLARVLVPVRWRGELLGSVIVIDADETLTADEMAMVEGLAREVADLLVAERHAADEETRTVEAAVLGWLGDDPVVRAVALQRLVDRGLVRSGQWVQVAIATGTDVGQAGDDRVALALRHTAELARSRARLRVLVAVEGGSAALVLLSGAEPGLEDDRAAGEQLAAGLHTLLEGRHAIQVGVGAPVDDLALAWRSHRQARVAARSVPALHGGPVQRWADIGPFQVLGRLTAAELDETVVPDPVTALVTADGQGRLVETLLAYLRHGGAGQATAAELHVHRTTLYYRLDRIRQITGLDVDDGDNRLLLHMGLLVRQLRPTS